jgi:hypothetical protein
MVRHVLVGFSVAAFLLLGGPALADSPSTETITEDVVNTFVDFLPTCEAGAPLFTFTTTNHRVEHSTTFDTGVIHGTVVETGTFVAVPLEDASLPTYIGQFTNRNSFFVENGEVVTNTTTRHVHGTGSDGSTLKVHVTAHTNVPPTDTVNEFFRCQ